MQRKNRKRLAMDVPVHVHNELKEMAKKYNSTVTTYVLRLLFDRLQKERKWDEPTR
jgi:hypothetical protein